VRKEQPRRKEKKKRTVMRIVFERQ